MAGATPWPNTANLMWDAAHHEGYPIFWNQNLAKFRMQMAPPIQAPGQSGVGEPVPPPAVPNTQSETARAAAHNAGIPPVPLRGIAVPLGGVVVGHTTVGGTLSVTGPGSFDDGATATGLTVNGSAALPGGATLGSSTVGGTLSVAGAATLAATSVGSLTITGSTTMMKPPAITPGAWRSAKPDGLLVGLVRFGSDARQAVQRTDPGLRRRNRLGLRNRRQHGRRP